MGELIDHHKKEERHQVSDLVMIELRKIIQIIDLNSKSLFRRVGLTGPQLVILREIAKNSEASVGEIARKVSLRQATVTGIMERMEKRGFVTRQRSREDRRRVMVRITETGQEVLAQAPPLMQEAFVERFSEAPTWMQNMILSSLQQLSSIMSDQADEATPFVFKSPIEIDQMKAKVNIDN